MSLERQTAVQTARESRRYNRASIVPITYLANEEVKPRVDGSEGARSRVPKSAVVSCAERVGPVLLIIRCFNLTCMAHMHVNRKIRHHLSRRGLKRQW